MNMQRRDDASSPWAGAGISSSLGCSSSMDLLSRRHQQHPRPRSNGLAAVGPRPGLCRLSRGRCESDPAPVNKKVRFSKAVVPALCSGISRDAPDRLRDQELGHQSRDGLRVLSAYERGSDSAVRREHATDLPKPAA
jgi:hypothetical protein